MTTNPLSQGKDSAESIAAALTEYEIAVVEAFEDLGGFIQILESTSLNRPGLDTWSWDKLVKVKRASVSRDGRVSNEVNAGFDQTTQNFISINQGYSIKNTEIERAALANSPLETATAKEVGRSISAELDFSVWNGSDAPAMTGISEESLINDAGAPAGVWDVSANAYNDILKIKDAISNKVNASVVIDIVCTPGLKKIFDRFVSDGTTTFPITFRTWIQNLFGGTIAFSSEPFTATTGPSSADKLTGTDGTATNVFVAVAKGATKLLFARDLTSVGKPVEEEGDIRKNVKLKALIQTQRPDHIAFMDAIDATT